MNFPALFPRSLSRAAWVFALLLALASQPAGGADTRQVGDLNADGVLSVVDLTLLRLHVRNIQKLEDRALVYADVNGDGVVNEDDAAALIRLITATDTPRVLPLTGIRETSPQNGESGVVSNRRTGIVVRFSLPLGANDLTQDNFYASVNGAKLKSRAAFSADHKTAALFVEDKIPGDARVDVTLKTDGLKDLLGRVIDGDGDGEPGGDYTFSYKTEPLVVAPNTKVIGTVYASEKVNGADKPLAGVIVRVAGTEDVQTLTDADGKFSLDCPPGRFFAEVDGRKVAGTDFAGGGAYYPYVIKAWEAVAGSTENLAAGSGKIYLPLIPAGALQSVDTTKETKVELTPEAKAANKDLAEVSLTVPPNALRKEDGSVGGKIGMAAVDPARTPEPLAAGLKFPLVITIQTDGSPVFDQPLPLKFPNLADPVTGVILKPGEKSALWSFNHDSGSWEMQGPMTVTDDGKYIVSDPGIGVRQAGWHGVLPGSQGVGPRRPISSPVAVEGVKKDVQNALTIAAQSSLPLRDAFLRFGAMRGLAEDLQQIRSMVDELRPMVDDYNRSGTLPYVWSTYWIKLRIGKLKASYSKLLGAGEGSLLTDMALLKPNLTTLKAALQSLQSFNQSVYSDYKSFQYLATDFATANATLLQTLVLTQEYLDALNAGLPSLNKAAFDNAVKVLFPPIGAADPTQTQEMDALTRFLAELEPVAAVVSSDHANRFLTLEYQMSDYLARAGAFSTAENPTPKSGYIVVDALGEPQRIRSNGSGDYRMVLPPNKEFAVTYVDPKTLRMGSYVGISNWNGVVTDLYGPVLAPLAAGYVDTDGDKLADVVEYVIGTDPKLKDTDKDGVSDYAEVTKGKNPLSGLAVGTGLVYSMTSSREGFEAVDVDTGNDLLLVAESAPGGTPELQGALVVYNIDNKLEPARQSVLALEFPAYRVRYGDGGYGILSLHENGVAIADVSNPSNAYLKARYPAEEGYSVNSAILVGDVLVLGMNHLWQENESKIVFKDLATGQTTFEQKIGGVISDMVASGTVVHVLNKGSKSTQYWWWYWALTTAVYTGDVSLGSLAAFTPVTVREWEWSKSGGRLALSSDRLFAVYESGLTSLRLADPLKPSMEGDVFKPESGFQRGWRQVLFDGSRDSADLTTFVAALGSSASDNGDADGDVAVFQFGLAKNFGSSSDSWWQYWLDGTTPMARFSTRFDARADNPSQPSLASGRIFSIAMAGGIVYGADKEKGVKVFNYRKYDSSGIPPTIQLLSNSPSPSQLLSPRIESGSLLSLRALVKDDVALSSVDWFVNGTRVASNGGFPWGYTLRMPSLKTEEISRRFKVEARAFDTGGNQATTSEWSFDVVRDAIPPKLLSATPSGGKALVEEVSVSFSEAMAPASLAGALRLFSPGPDGLMGTADDLQITGGSLLASETSLSLAFTSQLPEGHYRAKLQGTVSDLAGNPLGDDHSWDFSIAAANTWIGPALGLWADPANWSSGTVPVSGERVVFPREGAPRVIVGGRTTFTPTDASGNQLALVAGETKFSRLLTKNMPGGWWWWGNSNTPAPKGSVRAGMRVKGSKIADGTVVKSASITNDTSDPTSQKQTTMLELSNPLGEAVGDLPWVLSTALDLRSLQVDGETTLVDVDLEITEPIVLGAKLAFSGECNVSVESVRVAEAGSRLAIVAGVDTGTLVGGGSGTTSGLLRLNSGLKLTDNLGVEAVGIGGTTKLEVVSGLDLAGKQLDFFGGYGGAFKLTAGAGVKTFALTGPGKVAFKWQEGLLADGSLEAGKLLTKVSVPQLNLPEGVEWDVAGLGKVQLNAADFANNGTIRVEPNGWLKATRYRLVGDNARELVADTGTFEKMPSRAGGKDMITASFKGSNLAIKEDGTLWAWGYNGSGQLGLGYSSEVVNVPTQVGTDSDWNAVTAPSGGNSAFALKADGTLWAWGYNGSGNLGLGYSGGSVTVPAQVGTDSDWISVVMSWADGSSATYGLKSDGTLWAWGVNRDGEAGLGFSGEVTVPTRVGSAADWESVSVPQWGNGVFGLKTEGTLWAWGSNWNGELGLGSSGNTVATPTRVGTDSDWAKVVRFWSSSFGLKTDGTLWAWGSNWNGELGLGVSDNTVATPTQIGTDSDWVSAGYGFGLKSDGTLWVWGYNWSGELGLGYSGAAVTVPTQVGTDGDWSSISRWSGMYGISTHGIKADGTLWAWGYMGSYWDNGNYLENYLKEPTQVGTDADWNYLSAWYGVFGFKQDGSLWAWGYNWGGLLGTGRFEDYLTVPAKIESEVAWKLPSVVRINTNSPSPSNLRVPRIPSGSNLAVSATVLGKAQLGSIEWFLNGTRFASSKLAPWSANTLAPTLANDEQSRRVRIEAYVFDTRGDLLDIVRRDLDVVRDAIPPAVVGTPSIVSGGSGTTLQVGFSKVLDNAPVVGAFSLISAGNDGVFGSADDYQVQGGTVSISEKTAALTFENGLAGGVYRLVVNGGLLDSAGNPLGLAYNSDFETASLWIGPNLGLWSEPTNWSGGLVPREGTAVIFPATTGSRVVVGGTSSSLKSLQILGETTLVGVDLRVAENVSLLANLIFSGDNNLRASGIQVSPTGGAVLANYRIKVKAGVATGDFVPGQTLTRNGLLRLPSGLTLTDNLEVETAGMDGSTRLEVDSFLNLGGKTLRVLGGYAGSLKFAAGLSRAFTAYAFDGNAMDSSGNKFDGRVVGATLTQDRFGRENSAYEFFGYHAAAESYIYADPKVPFLERNFTASFWFRALDAKSLPEETTWATDYRYYENFLFPGEQAGEKSGIGIEACASGISVFEHGNSFLTPVLVHKQEFGNAWVHGVVTVEADGAPVLYVNGKKTRTGVNTGRAKVMVPFGRGSADGSGTGTGFGKGFHGTVDDVRVYNRTLSEGDIAKLYALESTEQGLAVDLAQASGERGFMVNGPGKIALDWLETVLADPQTQSEKLSLKVNAPRVTLAAGAELSVAGLGKVHVFSPGFTNAGTLRVADGGSLKVFNYTLAGATGAEVVASGGTFEKALFEKKADVMTTATFKTGANLAIKEDGTLWAWGYNGSGQLGLGYTSDVVSLPTQVSTDKDWISVVSSEDGIAALALKADHTLWAWGCGIERPIQIGSDEDWVRVVSDARWGTIRFFGLKANGTLWSLESLSTPITPVQIGTDCDWATVASWGGSQMAIKTDGTLWAWGYNSDSLGLGFTMESVSTPTQVGPDSDWTMVTTNNGASFGLKTDGTLWGWGYNGDGWLGLGFSSDRVSIPTQVGTDWNWSTVVTYGTSFGLKTDGTLWAWGYNLNGELGLGFKSGSVSTPSQVGTDGNWSTVVNAWPSLGLKTDGTLWAWGRNGNGELGLGFTSESVSTPTQVGPDSDWGSLFAYSGGFALKQDGSLWAWGYNGNGKLGTGNFADPLTQPTKIESTVAWMLPGAVGIKTNSPSPANLLVPRILSGGVLVLSATPLGGTKLASIEWFVNGTRLATATASPWSANTLAPALAEGEVSRRVHIEARVFNASGELLAIVRRELDVVRDATPPAVTSIPVVATAVAGTTVQVTFSKAPNIASLAGALKVLSAGGDGVFGTADDFEVQGATVTLANNTATLTFADGLSEGAYRFVAGRGIVDAFGNPLGDDYLWDFISTPPLVAVGATPAIHPPVPAGVDFTTGLVAHYPFNGDARDASGNGLDADVRKALATNDRFGNLSAYCFPQTDSMIVAPIGADVLSSDFSVSVWVKPENLNDWYPSVISGDSSFFILQFMGFGQNKLVFYQQQGEGAEAPRYLLETFRSDWNSGWAQLTVVRKGLSASLSVNGRKVSQAQIDPNLVLQGRQLAFGNSFSYDANYTGWARFQGSIDDVRIYNRALTSAEVGALYAAEVSLPAVDPNGHVAVPIPGTNVAFSKYETTVGQWKAFVAETGWNKTPDWTVVSYQDTSYSLADNQPVVAISRDDANEYCAWLSRKTGKRWRLPSEEEWLKADQNFTYPWGDYFPPLATDGNFQFEQDGYTIAAPVGSFSPNALGLYDLAGNVWEWTTSSAPDGNAIIKGGNFELTTNEQEIVKNSYHLGQGGPHGGVGFRVVQDLSAKLVSVAFNRPIAQDRASNAVVLYSAGADGLLGTADDVRIEPASVSVSGTQLQLAFASDLADGLYRGVVAQGVTDVAGIGMLSDYTWEFAISSEARWVGPSAGAWDAPANWSQGRVPTAFDHVVLPLEGSPRVIQVNGVVGVRSLKVLGETTLMNAQVGVVEDLTLSENLRFSGECSLGARGVVATRSGARLCVSTPGVEAPAARLSLSRGLALLGDLEVESAGRSALTTLEIVGNLDLAGHTLQVFGGVQGSVRFVDSVDTGGFALNGPGKVAFDWQELLLEDPDLDWSELYLRVDANSLTLPQGVEWNVAGLGLVEVWASSFLNRGKVHVQESGWLKIYNYTRVGDAQENTGADAVFEKLNM